MRSWHSRVGWPARMPAKANGHRLPQKSELKKEDYAHYQFHCAAQMAERWWIRLGHGDGGFDWLQVGALSPDGWEFVLVARV